MMRNYLVILSFFLCYLEAHGDYKAYYATQAKNQFSWIDLDTSTKELWFNQKVDHFGDGAETFKQKLFINEEHGSDLNAPVLFVICGEGACRKPTAKSSVYEHAKALGAKIVTLEHRYYGDSQPFPELTALNLSFLTTRQALADLFSVQQNLIKTRGWKGKWIMVGGSYAGNLAAFYAVRYPKHTVGVIASSAPVIAKNDFFEYDGHIHKVAGVQCVQDILDVTKQVEQQIVHQFAKIKEVFSAGEIRQPKDFLYLLADISAAAVQYGHRDDFCQEIHSANPLKSYAKFGRKILKMWGAKPVDFTFQSAEPVDTKAHTKGVGMRQWLYQSCTEYGFWQIAHPDPKQRARSTQINLDFHKQTCLRLFGIKQLANTKKFNQVWFNLIQNSDAHAPIIFTNGDQDPWAELSVKPNTKISASSQPKVTSWMIKEAAHCDDLSLSKTKANLSVEEAFLKTRKMMQKWLQ